ATDGLGAVKHHVLEHVAQGFVQVVVDGQLAGVDDTHAQTLTDRVVKEDSVNRLTHGVVATEGEADIGNAAGYAGVRQVLRDPACRVNEVDGIVVVLLNPGCDGKYVGIEDDVFGRETHFVAQNAIR